MLGTTLEEDFTGHRSIIFQPFQEKSAILSNTAGSESFDEFVAGLGWLVRPGKNHLGYAGGLTGGICAPYYASADNEMIFHISTKLGGSFLFSFWLSCHV